MKLIEIFFYYITWHYSHAILEYIKVWRNLLWFSLNYFSVYTLLKTLFKPFFRLSEKTSTNDLDRELKIVSILSGLFGLMVRLLSIIAGITSWVFILIGGMMLSIVWLCLPFLVFFFFITGFMAVFGLAS